MKTTIASEKEKILEKISHEQITPFPWQDDGSYYPDFDKYGKLFGECQVKESGRAKSHIEAYLNFVEALDHIASVARQEGREEMLEEIREGFAIAVETNKECNMDHKGKSPHLQGLIAHFNVILSEKLTGKESSDAVCTEHGRAGCFHESKGAKLTGKEEGK